MKKQYFACYLLSVVAYFLSSCSSNEQADNAETKQALIAHIDSLQDKMFNQQSMELDKELGAKTMIAYQDFVKRFPQDSVHSAEYLFRFSDLSRAMGENMKAIESLSQICSNYPAYKKIPECLFLQGYYYQEFFGDTIQARNFYTQLVSQYPTHAFADDAKALMQMFGKSQEDIIKDFEKKDKEAKKK